MALLGQASGGFTESSSALRILHVGVRNTISVLSADAFTQTNPPIVSTVGTVSTSPGALTEVLGVLSGSVAFARPDAGNNSVGGPHLAAGLVAPVAATHILPVGMFINNASGNAYENLPAAASGKGPYVSAMGTYGSRLYETQLLVTTGGVAAGTALTYLAGLKLAASQNGWLMPTYVWNGAAWIIVDVGGGFNTLESINAGAVAATTIGILKVAPDSAMSEIVFDQRI